MEIEVAGRTFSGPFTETSELINRSGIYFVARMWHGNTQVLQVGESRMLKEAADRWLPANPPIQPYQLAVFVHYTPSLDEQSRKCLATEVAQELQAMLPDTQSCQAALA